MIIIIIFLLFSIAKEALLPGFLGLGKSAMYRLRLASGYVTQGFVMIVLISF